MAVTKLWVDGEVQDPGAPPSTEAHKLLFHTAGLCNNARVVNGGERGDPNETALLRAVPAIAAIDARRLREVPFDADRKMMSTVNTLPEGMFVLTKGALERVLPRCTAIMDGGRTEPLAEENRGDITRAYHVLMDLGLRVLAFAYKKVPALTPAHRGGEGVVMGSDERDFAATRLFDMSRGGGLDVVQLVVAMVTITLSIPCIANVFMIAKERGWRTAGAMAAFIFPLAVAAGGLVRVLMIALGFGGAP